MATKLEIILGLRDSFSKGWNKAEGDFKRGVKNIRSSWQSLATLPNAIAAAAPALLAKDLLNASMEMEALEAKLAAALPAFGAAGNEMNFLREETERLGVNFQKTASEYATFAAASVRAGLSLEQTRKIFTGISEAAVSLKLNATRVSFVFQALSQIASKGFLSLEELKRQLGDHLPAAVQIGARAMGMSNQAFIKAVENQKIYSRDFLPKFAEQVRKELGGGFDIASEQIQASTNRMNNAFFELRVNLGNMFKGDAQKGIDTVTKILQFLNKHVYALKAAFEALTTPVVILWNGLQLVYDVIGYLIDAGSSLIAMILVPFKELFGFIADQAEILGRQLYALIHRDFKSIFSLGADKQSLKERWDNFINTEKELLKQSDGILSRWGAAADGHIQDIADKLAKTWVSILNSTRVKGPGSTKAIYYKKKKKGTGEDDEEFHKKWLKDQENALKRFDKMMERNKKEFKKQATRAIDQQQDALELLQGVRIDNMREGFDKELALIDFRYEKEKEKVRDNAFALRLIEKAHMLERNKAMKDFHKQQITGMAEWTSAFASSLMELSANNKKSVGLYKVASVAQILADTYLAAQSAFTGTVRALGGGPWAYVPAAALAATITAGGLARADRVANLKYALGERQFRTSRPTMIMVGDNPGGREVVSVTPESSQNVSGPSVSRGTTMVINFHDHSGNLTQSIRKQIRAGGDADRMVRDIFSRAQALGVS